MKKKQKGKCICDLINTFINDDDDDDKSRNGNSIFFCLPTEPSTFSILHLKTLIHLFLVKFEMI